MTHGGGVTWNPRTGEDGKNIDTVGGVLFEAYLSVNVPGPGSSGCITTAPSSVGRTAVLAVQGFCREA